MTEKVAWLLVFVALYGLYCIVCGVTCSRTVRTAGDYFIAGRRLGPWVFILGACPSIQIWLDDGLAV